MNLNIEVRNGKFFVEIDDNQFESQSIASILENVFTETDLRDDALLHLSTLFNDLAVERITLYSSGERWLAGAEIPVLKDYTNKYYDVEEYDPISALRALETAIKEGWDDECGLNTIDRIQRWSWFV